MSTFATTILDRRELLQRVASLMGCAVSAPAMLGLLGGCQPQAGKDWRPAFLTAAQLDSVTQIAEIMIPRTETPGAQDVGVPAFIDAMLHEVYAPADQQRFVTGLAEFETLAQREFSQPFNRLGAAQQAMLVRRVHDAALQAAQARVPDSAAAPRPCVLMIKELALLGYFSSEAGATQVLQYIAVPGAYHGCVPLPSAGNGRTWATE